MVPSEPRREGAEGTFRSGPGILHGALDNLRRKTEKERKTINEK